MRWAQVMNGRMLGWTLVLGAAFACGGAERQIHGSLEAPVPRQARIALTPVLDVSALDPQIADRLVIDQITVHLAEARLLGSDPRIPVGGLSLLSGARDVSAYGGGQTAVLLPFPEYLLEDADLGVYVRLDRAMNLGGASVVVKARMFAQTTAQTAGASPLTAAPDPDGDPADPGTLDHHQPRRKVQSQNVTNNRANQMAPDPDGDPASPCAPDPDGDPATPPGCHNGVVRHGLVQRGKSGPSVTLELRGSDAADLVANLNSSSKLNVTIGIPAARWFTGQTISQIDRAIADGQEHDGTAKTDRHGGVVVVSEPQRETDAVDHNPGEGQGRAGAGDYSISDDPMMSGRLKVHL